MTTPSAPRLVLASASPRRRALLEQIGVAPDAVRPADIDETPRPRELPRAYVARMAAEKLDAACRALRDAPENAAASRETLVLAADTVVAVGRRILGKPESPAEAERFLRLLSGRRHRVGTAVALRRLPPRGDDRTPDAWTRLVESAVSFKRLSEPEIAWHLATEDWRGKAGGYAIQGAAARLIPWMSGSYSAIVGLPLAETAALLDAAGLPAAAPS